MWPHGNPRAHRGCVEELLLLCAPLKMRVSEFFFCFFDEGLPSPRLGRVDSWGQGHRLLGTQGLAVGPGCPLVDFIDRTPRTPPYPYRKAPSRLLVPHPLTVLMELTGSL